MALTKAKATKPSKVVKPKTKTRKTTQSQRNYQYISFNERIGTLKIDPVRRKRNNEEREELVNDQATYFGRSLARWQDVNLSATFVTFATKAAPLTDNLALLLHNKSEVLDLLVEHIERRDALAMEPLLCLLSDFAHDLDVRFEPYFEVAVRTVSAVAAKHEDAAVVEWSFNCLAWLFKYLARLLVPDLRPIHNLMAPYLGRESQKPYVVRFAAESMSFLIRKSAVSFERDSAPLTTIIEHILQDLEDNNDDTCINLYQQGVMVLLTDAVKGVQNSLHSSGQAILRTLVRCARAHPSQTVRSIVVGILTSLIHFTTRETFRPIQDIILEDCNREVSTTDIISCTMTAELLFTTISVRKASRISDWAGVLDLLSQIMERLEQQTAGSATDGIKLVSSTLAVTILYCAQPTILVRTKLLDMLWQGKWSTYFLQICDFVARISPERFERLLHSKFCSYMLQYLNPDNLADTLLLVPTVLESCGSQIDLSTQTQASLVQHIRDMADSSPSPPGIGAAIIEALPFLKFDKDHHTSIITAIDNIIQSQLCKPAASPERQALVFGIVLKQWLSLNQAVDTSASLLESVSKAAAALYRTPIFWNNLTELMSRTTQQLLQGSDMKFLEQAMLQALCLSDHRLRLSVLDTLRALYTRKMQVVPSVLSTAILIESTPITLDTTRSISMNIRHLATEYLTIEKDDLLSQAIPIYCLGMLHIRLSQVWDDAITTLGEICKSTIGEQAMMKVIQEWLFAPAALEQESNTTILIKAESPTFQVVSDFECPNLARMQALSEQVFEEPHSGRPDMASALKATLSSIPSIPATARSQALRVLDRLPHIAEKRSRLIVPTLLQWTGIETDDQPVSDRWNRKDQKTMLHVFSQFQNPRVLFRSKEVYDALLQLCSNGDLEIQQAALKALLAWKTPEVNRYEEHLLHILDEARFREELSVFLQGDEEEGLREPDIPIVMPVLLRLLYGRTVGGSKDGQQAKRKAVFIALSSFPSSVMAAFVDIILSSTKSIQFMTNDAFNQTAMIQLTMSVRQQLGMLNTLADMIETLGAALLPLAAPILNTLVGCTVIASRKLELDQADVSDTSLLRAVRQNGLRGLHKLFNAVQSDEFTSQCQVVANELLHYRLTQMVAETGQGISATIRLIAAWSNSSIYAAYLATEVQLLNAVADLMQAGVAKSEVRLFVLTQVFDPLLSHEAAVNISPLIISHLAKAIASVLLGAPEKDLLEACVRTLQKLAGNLQDAEQVASVLGACQSLLTQPSQIVPTRTKVGLLRTMLPLLESNASSNNLYEAVCGLFSRLHDLEGRALLSEVFSKLATTEARREASEVCHQLNKLHVGRLDEPDYASREEGFDHIYEQGATWTVEQWSPVMHNCLHFLRDETDTVNRASASKSLQLLISSAANEPALLPLVQVDLFGAIQRGMTQKSEFVRAEYLNLLHAIVMQLKEWKEVSDMEGLAFDGDDEASFFTNVLHIQQHRRLRALRRLGEVSINSKNITRLFLPLLEQFILDQAEGDAGRTLSDQAIQTIGQLARRLRWSDLRKTLSRYYGFLKTKDDLEKTILRLIGALIDGLTTSMTEKTEQSEDAESTTSSLPENRIIVVTREFLPPLQLFLHQKDESKVDRRVAVAISIVKLARLLPDEEFAHRLAPTLTDIAHILRSRDLEARDQTRRTLSTILGIIGPNYLQFILKELRSALQRGYQLHVLSYTVHHLMVANGVDFKPGDIDESIPELSSIILDDIFGVTGQEKDAEEYKSGMKEVKSSKSYDTMEILARMASVSHLGQLIMPIRALLQEKLDSRVVKKIDDLLLRIRRGIDLNPAADTRDMLIFCHELVRQVYAQQAIIGREAGLEDWKLKKYLMQNKNQSGVKGSTTSYIFKLSAFALALLRKVLRRHEDLQTPVNLKGFLPMIGDGLVSGQLDVKIESAKLLSTILRVELAEIDAGISIYLKEAIAMVKGSHSTINDTARAGLELATAILRERRDADVRDRDVGVLVRAIKADIDEPDRQGQTFRFLRAVLGRKIIIPEIYEVMDDVARIMVNNSDESVRQNARAAYVQFVIDFPQGKERWAKTTAFLVKNLGFEHAGGRKSILEVVHTLLGRVNAGNVQEVLLSLFIGLVPRIISDNDASCREMASVLSLRVLEKSDNEQQSKIKSLANKWLHNDTKDGIRQAAIVSWTLLLRADRIETKEGNTLLGALSTILDPESGATTKLSTSSLELFMRMCELRPEQAFSKGTAELWTHVLDVLRSESTEQHELALTMLAMLYNDIASTTARSSSSLKAAVLQTSAGLKLGDDMLCHSCVVHLRALRNVSPAETNLIAGLGRNLNFFGRIFAANGTQWHNQKSVGEASGDDQDDDDDDAEDTTQRETSALGYLVSRMTYIVRREELSAIVRTAALQIIATLVQTLDQDISNIRLVIRPLYILTDASIPQPHGEDHKALTDKARETLDLVQSKVGAQKFVEMLADARKDVIDKRSERRRKRKIEAISQPEKWAKEKKRRGEVKKAKSKERSELNRSRRRGW